MVQLLPALHSRALVCGRHMHDCSIWISLGQGFAVTPCPEGGCPGGFWTGGSLRCLQQVPQPSAVEVTTALQGQHWMQQAHLAASSASAMSISIVSLSGGTAASNDAAEPPVCCACCPAPDLTAAPFCSVAADGLQSASSLLQIALLCIS